MWSGEMRCGVMWCVVVWCVVWSKNTVNAEWCGSGGLVRCFQGRGNEMKE